MSSKIHILKNYEQFIDVLANPNPQEIYHLIPEGYAALGNINIAALSNAVLYSDLLLNGIPKLYPSFTPEMLNSGEVFLSPLIINTNKPLILDKGILNNPHPIHHISVAIFQRMIGTHIPQILYQWNHAPQEEKNIAL